MAVVLTPWCAQAQDDEYVLEDAYKPTYAVHFKMATEATTNMYSANVDAESDTVARLNLYGNAEIPRGSKGVLRVDFDITQNDFRRFTTEDFRDSSLNISYEQRLGGNLAGIQARFGDTDASEQALDTLSSRTRAFEAFYALPATDKDTLRIKVFTGLEKYRNFETLESKDHGWGAVLTHDFGSFTYGDLEYKVTRTHYPNEQLVDLTYTEIPAHRSDRTSSFVASVSRLYSLYPLAYVQVSYENNRNVSDSNGYYFWFNDNTFVYGEKLLPGYDSYRETAWSVFALKDLDDRNSLSVYYLVNKISYPQRLVGNFGQVEPHEPTANTLTYLMVDLQRRITENLTADLSGTWVHSRSNEGLYAYDERLTSLGFIAKF